MRRRPPPGGGTFGTGTTTGANTTSTSGPPPTTGADDTTDDTGGAASCLDMLGEIGTPADAYPLHELDGPGDYRHELDGVVCDGESDYFVYNAPCDGYFGVEVRATDFDDQNDDVTLVLTDDAAQELVVSDGSRTFGAHRMELAHTKVTPGSYGIEVRHESGGAVDYEITTYFLPTGSCLAAAWTCEAVSSLAATETSCRAAPVAGACPAGATVTNAVSLPEVGTGASAFDGWLVNFDADEIAYHGRPTSAELTAIADRCEDACEAEWADNPDVAANCSAGFEPPELYIRPSHSALAVIPAAMQDGSGIFGTESLSCNLHTTCCEDFDEALCVAAPQRVTPASDPLAVGEEYVFLLDETASKVAASADVSFVGTSSITLEGDVGFSHCESGSGSDPCPFYLGHLALHTDGVIDVDATCPDGTVQTIEVADLEVDLAQPAFGIDESGTDDKAFPPGALVFAGTFSFDHAGTLTPYDLRGVNRDVVHLEASATNFEALDVQVSGTAPCGDGSTNAVGEFSLFADIVAGRWNRHPRSPSPRRAPCRAAPLCR